MNTKTRENKSDFEERKSYSNVKRWRIYLNVLNKCPRTCISIENALLSHLSEIFRKIYQKRTNDVVEKLIQRNICFSRNLFLWQVSWTCSNKLIPADTLPGRSWAITRTTWKKTIKFSTQSYRAWTSRIMKCFICLALPRRVLNENFYFPIKLS